MHTAVFTYGDRDPEISEGIGAYLARKVEQVGLGILGQSSGSGSWGGSPEACGSLVVVDTAEPDPSDAGNFTRLVRFEDLLTEIAAGAAERFGQDAVGLFTARNGRSLVTADGVADGIVTAAEVWGD